MGSVGNAALTAARGRLALRRHLATTPGRLRLAAVLLALGAIVFGVVASHGAGSRHDAVENVVAAERLLFKAVELTSHLSDAHATAAVSFLAGGPEPAFSRDRYADELRDATYRLADLAAEIEPSTRAGRAVRVITRSLPLYAGLVDSARANYRLGFPIGTAYLREASNTMHRGQGAMLPSARNLYEIQAIALTASYERGASTWMLLAILLAGGALLAILVTTQIYIARTTHRVLNLRLVLATVLLLGLLCWSGVALEMQRSALVQAQRTGSDPVELLTAVRILASRGQSDESIALSARGGGEGEPRIADVDRGFLAVVKPIDGLLRQAAAIPGSSHDASLAIASIVDAYARYHAAHDRVVEQERSGEFGEAIRLAVRQSAGDPSTTQAAADLTDALGVAISLAQDSFHERSDEARAALGGLLLAIPLLTALCAALALAGVRERLEEYR